MGPSEWEYEVEHFGVWDTAGRKVRPKSHMTCAHPKAVLDMHDVHEVSVINHRLQVQPRLRLWAAVPKETVD